MIVAELRAGIDDGDDPSARQDIVSLLQKLRDRPDVTYRTRTEVDELIATLMPPAPAAQTWYGPPPAYQPPPGPYNPPPPSPPKSKKGLFIGAGVAAAVIAVVVAILVATSGGDSKPADNAAPPSPSETAKAPTPRAMLLTPGEVASTMGLDTIDPKPIAAQMDISTLALSRPECLGASYIVMGDAYRNSGYTAVAFQGLQSKGYDSIWVGQGVVAYPSDTEAQAFLEASGTQWSACAGDIVTMTAADVPDQQWSYKDVDRSDSQITQVSEQLGTGGYGCQHVLRRTGSTLIDTLACRTPPGDEASRLADQIAAKA